MKKLIFVLALSLTLPGCALFKNFSNPITQSRLDTMNTAFGTALALAANYRDACANRALPPSCRSIVVSLQKGALPVKAALDQANGAALGGTTNAAALLEKASDALNDYKTLQMQYGVQ